MEGLSNMGYKQPTAIQQQAIPAILQNKDLIACAQTGTGKTASFILPVMHHIIQSKDRHVSTLILVPTRELAVQIDQHVEGFSYFTDVSSIAVYGGGDGSVYEQQRRALIHGTDIIIATPGRLIAHLVSGIVKLDYLQHLVLDEADRMLDMGFSDDIMRIVSYLPKKRQTLLFSATMPPKIRTLANKLLHEPEQINVAISQPASGILQQAYMVFDEQKIPLIESLLKDTEYKSIIVFASRKDKVKDLEKSFKKIKIESKAFHSDLDQSEREIIMRSFKNKQLRVIIGTDVLSRGIDITGIDLVVNFDVPPDPEDYIHRIGRTARAESTGTAITFINEKDQRRFSSIENLIGREIDKLSLPEGFGDAPVYNPKAKSSNDNNKRRNWKKKKPQQQQNKTPN
ncbi:DEAD/DEAH box helicase [Pedobacter sp. HMF7647]|uniref:DEAD/DEAH box helicase n=2 Tax=Hufsiella arboris TaxID=2695275 RepID=A0A7K1YC12_9SPHI|nr:DEAD/DEAH box helicase [Hufsiella arboris]